MAKPVTVLFMSLLAMVTKVIMVLTQGPAMFLKRLMWWLVEKPRIVRQLRKTLKTSKDYSSWANAGVQLDKLRGLEDWKKTAQSRHYDFRLIGQRLLFLREVARSGDVNSMIFHLRAGMLRNFAGITNPRLYQKTHAGTKVLIEEYLKEVIEELQYLYNIDYKVLPLDTKSEFFAASYQIYGRSALILQGTVAFAVYQLGIVKALHDSNMLPKVICGSSAGALVAAVVCCQTDEDLPAIFEKDAIDFSAFQKRGEKGRFKRRLIRLLRHGVLMDIKIVQQALYDNIGNVTFLEAYEKTGRLLNITLKTTGVFGNTRLLNYLNAPNVIIWSAACASCSSIGLYETVDVLAKTAEGTVCRWNPEEISLGALASDGDFHLARLSELFFVNHFIVSRVLPYETPLTANAVERNRVIRAIFRIVRAEVKHRFQQLDEFHLLPSIVKSFFNIYGGDINIVPELTLQDYAHMFSLPTADMVQYCILQGERATWPLMTLIKARMGIEKQLETFTQELRRDREEAVAQREKNGAPSPPGKIEKRRRSTMF